VLWEKRNDYDYPNVCMGDGTAVMRSLSDQSYYMVALVYNIELPHTYPLWTRNTLGHQCGRNLPDTAGIAPGGRRS